MLNIVQHDFEPGYSKITLCVCLDYFGQLSNEYTAQFSWIVQLKFVAKLNAPQRGISEWIKPDFQKVETMDYVESKVKSFPTLSTFCSSFVQDLFFSASGQSLPFK